MPDRTVTRTIEDDLDPDTILAVLMDPRLIPRWAPVFADEVEKISSDAWQVTKNGQTFAIEMEASPSSRTVDYLREIAPGKRGGACIRVLPRPGGGSVVIMTLPVPGDTSAERLTSVLVEELKGIVDLSKTSRSTQ
jgi:hypothetical protein